MQMYLIFLCTHGAFGRNVKIKIRPEAQEFTEFFSQWIRSCGDKTRQAVDASEYVHEGNPRNMWVVLENRRV